MSSNLINQFKAARICYTVGYPWLSDVEYDLLKDEVAKQYPELAELDEVYEDDQIDYEALEECKCPRNIIDLYVSSRGIKSELKYDESRELLDTDNVSIRPYKTEEEVKQAIAERGYGIYIATPKIDGIFITAIYEQALGNKYILQCGETRGSTTNSVDVTSVIKYMLPNVLTIDNAPRSIKKNFECTATMKDAIRMGNVSPRSAAQSVIVAIVNKKPEYYDRMRFYLHGSSVAENTEDIYLTGEKLGFRTVPFVKVEITEETDISALDKKISEEFANWAEQEDIDIDGVVYKIDDVSLLDNKTIGSKIYKANTFASKVYFWSRGIFTAKILSITKEYSDSRISLCINIEPTKTKSNTVSQLTNITLDTLIQDNIKAGDYVDFEYLNNSTPKFLRKSEPNERICEESNQFS